MTPDCIDLYPEELMDPDANIAFVMGYDDGSWLAVDYFGDWWTAHGDYPSLWKEINPEKIPSFIKEFWDLVVNQRDSFYLVH